MSETLCAVIIGGIIGVIGSAVASIPSLVVNERRWKKEKKLEHLRAERRHKEEQYRQIIVKLPDLLEKGGDNDTVARMGLTLPDDIVKKIFSIMLRASGGKMNRVEIISQIAPIGGSLRKELVEIDKQIDELMS